MTSVIRPTIRLRCRTREGVIRSEMGYRWNEGRLFFSPPFAAEGGERQEKVVLVHHRRARHGDLHHRCSTVLSLAPISTRQCCGSNRCVPLGGSNMYNPIVNIFVVSAGVIEPSGKELNEQMMENYPPNRSSRDAPSSPFWKAKR